MNVFKTADELSTRSNFFASGAIKVPCKATENNAMKNTMWKISYCITALFVTASIAKIIDEAPLIPTQDANNLCFRGTFKNSSIPNVAIGLATKIRNSEIKLPGIKTDPK